MKMLGFIIFFTVFFSVYTAGNFYVFMRSYHALSLQGWQNILFISGFAFLWLSFIVSRFTGHTQLFTLHHVLTWAGSFWLVIVFYAFLLVLSVDIVRLFNLMFHFLPEKGSIEYIQLKKTVFWIGSVLILLVVAIGHINAIMTKVNRIEIVSSKNVNNRKSLKVGLASDIHLGTLVGKYRLEKMMRLMNQEKPDIILLAGDLLDEAQEPILNEDIGAPLRKLHAPLGVFAVPGNHEYIGGIKQASEYIKSLGIKLLKDSVDMPEKNIIIVGRDDIQANRFDGSYKRKQLKELVLNLDSSNFIILMDHQPYKLEEADLNNIDLQVSGHTHHGQFWPFNYITKAIFEVSRGYKKKGDTHIFVSTGFGSWGPPVRIGNRPEIAIINVTFTDSKE
jgi:predicted MPP superfamily phosphohydrolase